MHVRGYSPLKKQDVPHVPGDDDARGVEQIDGGGVLQGGRDLPPDVTVHRFRVVLAEGIGEEGEKGDLR